MSSFPFSLSAAQESTAHHRHQASLETILDFNVDPLTATEQADADLTFNQLISHAEPLQGTTPYMRATLVRLTYEHCRSKDAFLRQFFMFINGDGYNDHDHDNEDAQNHKPHPSFERGLAKFHGFASQTAPTPLKREAENAIDSFAEHIFQHFFLPMKAAGAKTQQPSKASSTGPALENVIGSSARLSTLRRDCLIRDHHRCVVTRAFDLSEAISRDEKNRLEDDDGRPLDPDSEVFNELEVAHIIPHSIMSAKSTDGELQLSESKKTALSILNMFDPGVVHLIEGPNIDQPFNAISLTSSAHKHFGLFRISFEALSNDPSHPQPRHTYRIHASQKLISSTFKLPVTRTLLMSPNHTIDPPSPKLLALHRAITIILELSAAAGYVDRIIRHMEEVAVRSDGSAELGRIVTLRMGGWLDGVA
ncbi:hypothetical protein FQN52_009158 [Onygenales sp. PD_12]|nr:hypothetical protein FQN52_009158 [Onygenales sp. PD_12]